MAELLKIEKCKNLVSYYETFKNLPLRNCTTNLLDIAHK